MLAVVASHASFAQTVPAVTTTPAVAPAPATTGSSSRPIRALGDINPLGGDINAFNGDINPFTGDINPFGGDLNPFGGDINPFGGDINPFTGDINPFEGGDINPFGGDINPFWGTRDPRYLAANPGSPNWLAIGSYWADANKSWVALSAMAAGLPTADAATRASFISGFTKFVAQTEAAWGAAVTAHTGKSFTAAFLNPILAKYGLTAASPEALATLTQVQRNRFYLDWYDGLMLYSGVDRVDHWMSAVRWSPAITQQQGSGADTVIGLLDANPRADTDVANNIAWSGGYLNGVSGHGAGVASLMVASHDGNGVMGIAPRARVVTYNPFDASNSASWADAEAGVNALRERGASIINASLGIAGWTMPQEWQAIMAKIQRIDAMPAADPSVGLLNVAGRAKSTPVYVIAAGNDGISQTANLNWDFAVNPAFLVVGSVDNAGTISTFSNRPGTACLLKGGVCLESNRLMNSFIVAPGEFILVSGGPNGVVRASGTSFPAPMVSGAIALLHDRWPWLARYPHETVKIITSTARDLGAPGVDPVYGVGMLDIAASQSPINFGKLAIFKVANGIAVPMSAPQLLRTGVQSTWEAQGVYFTMFEAIGATYRDFQVPMSSRLTGMVRTWSGRREYFQSFITRRFSDWMDGKQGFTDLASYGVAMPNGMKLHMAGTAPAFVPGSGRVTGSSAMTVEMPGGRFAFTGGYGVGAAINGAQPGFNRSVDYSSSGGGANPLLGLASGGSFLKAQARFGKGKVSLGFTENTLDRSESGLFDESERREALGMASYRARALNINLTRSFGSRITLALDYARLHEANALLGVQSTLASDLEGGASSDVFTAGAELDLGRGLTIAATGTQGRSRTGREQTIISEGAVGSSAYALGLRKLGVATRNDLASLTISQPLQVHESTLSVIGTEILDRSTGELGSVSQSFGIGGGRRQLVGELQYGASFANGAGRFGLYGKGDLQAAGTSKRAFVAGGEVSLRF